MLKVIAMIQSYIKNDDGATAIEYGLIAAGIALAIAAIVFTLGGTLETTFTDINTEVSGAGN